MTSEINLNDLIIRKDFYDEKSEMIPLSKTEIRDICELDSLCYDPGLEYDEEDVNYFIRLPGALLIRFFLNEKMIALQMSNFKRRELTTLDVHPEYRRLGLGRKMLETTLDELKNRGLTKVHCQIAVNNIASILLHHRMGFRKRYIIPYYYPDGTSAYWFEKKL